MPSSMFLLLRAAIAAVLLSARLTYGLNATAWASIGRAAVGAYSENLAVNITVGPGYVAPAEPYTLKSGVGVIINFCAAGTSTQSFVAAELFQASAFRRMQVEDLGYVVGDVFRGCISSRNRCCKINFTPAIAGVYSAVNTLKGNALVATFEVVDQVVAETIEQVTRPGWTPPVVGDLATLKAQVLPIRLVWVNETNCPGNDGTLNLKYRYSGGHTNVPNVGFRLVDPALNPVQMLAGKGYMIKYQQFPSDNAEAYLSAIEFYSQAYTEVTFKETTGLPYATALFATYPQHIELFARKTLVKIFAVPTVPGLYPFTNRHDPADTYPGIFQVLNPLLPVTIRNPSKITTVRVPNQCP